MADCVQRTLAQAGLERYEISNYARPGLESRHNVNYWEGGDYLGVGAGAHSHHRMPGDPLGERWQNERSPTGYMRRAGETGDAVTERERPELRQAMGEHLFTGAADDRRRLGAGVSTAFRNGNPRTLSPKSRTGSHRACWQRTANGCALRHEVSC